jgi:ABC-type multidrug transport system ATPase subunit
MSRHPTRPQRETRPPGALETVELTKDYGDGPALAPLSVRIEPGEQVALIGHNGSGKTTLLRLAAGLLEPTAGSVRVFGEAAGSLPSRRRVAYLSDHPTFYDDLSVWEHLEYVARMHGVDDWDELAAELLDHVGLYDRADDLPSRFSRGLRQKAAIALAFVRPFDLLLVDEPFVGLDASGKDALLGLLTQAGLDGAALVVATHELSYVERVGRIVALRDGVVVHDGPVGAAEALALVRSERDG